MDCVITITGNLSGKHGNPKTPQERTVRDFIVNNQVFQKQILKHVKTCEKCSPTEIVQAYLDNRKTPKLKGLTTPTLLNDILKYEKLGDRSPPKKLINEFIWRTADVHVIGRHVRRLEETEIIFGMYWYRERIIEGLDIENFPDYVHHQVSQDSWLKEHQKESSLIMAVANSINDDYNMDNPKHLEEIKNLISVNYVLEI